MSNNFEPFERMIKHRKATYTKKNGLLEITCANGHVFQKTKHQIHNGEWCGECFKNIYINEEKCRFVLEQLTGKPFIKTRRVLRNYLELDMYNEELSLALEYQGPQHFEFLPFFHKTIENFYKRVETDEIKRKECKEKEILLLEVNYLDKTDENKEKTILKLLKAYNIPIVKDVVDWGLFYENFFHMNRVRAMAVARGGLCHAKTYIDNATPVPWECSLGHTWEASPNSIHNGTWCPQCATSLVSEKRKKPLEDLRELASKNGGEYVKGDYSNSNEKVLWKCKNGHIFPQSISAVQQGSWCTTCTGTSNHTIEVLKEKANSLQGKCLSKSYHGNRELHLFQCKEGHVWLATANKVLSGSWCHYCGGNKPIGIDRINQIAHLMSGICLTKDYKNNATKLSFICEHGHPFKRTLVALKYKRWCPTCKDTLDQIPDELLFASYQTKSEKENVFQQYHELVTKSGTSTKKMTTVAKKRKKFLEKARTFLSKQRKSSYTIDTLRTIASFREGKVLEEDYTYADNHYEWQCDQNHTFSATASNVFRGKWCPYCANQKMKIEDMQKVAEAREGKLHSPTFTNARTKYTWECKEGHIWTAVWGSIKNGTWCPVCNGTTGKVTLEKAQQVAKELGGECLSTTYKNVNTQMKWKCADSHVFKATYNNVRRKKWCPYCAGKKKVAG
ncbi:hypothetical protein ACWZQY_023950 [Priestia megaterium]